MPKKPKKPSQASLAWQRELAKLDAEILSTKGREIKPKHIETPVAQPTSASTIKPVKPTVHSASKKPAKAKPQVASSASGVTQVTSSAFPVIPVAEPITTTSLSGGGKSAEQIVLEKAEKQAAKERSKEWTKNRRRIKAFIREKKKLGFVWDNEDELIPDRPKVVSQEDLDLIKNIRPSWLYKNARYVHPLTGEVFTVEQGKEIARTLVLPKPQEGFSELEDVSWETLDVFGDVSYQHPREDYNPPRMSMAILNRIEEKIASWDINQVKSQYRETIIRKRENRNALEKALNDAIYEFGTETVAMRLELNAEEVNRSVDRLLYESDAEWEDQAAFNVFFSTIYARAVTMEESAELQDYSEMQLSFSDYDI